MIVDQMAQDNVMHFYANKEILWAYDADKDGMQCNWETLWNTINVYMLLSDIKTMKGAAESYEDKFWILH